MGALRATKGSQVPRVMCHFDDRRELSRGSSKEESCRENPLSEAILRAGFVAFCPPQHGLGPPDPQQQTLDPGMIGEVGQMSNRAQPGPGHSKCRFWRLFDHCRTTSVACQTLLAGRRISTHAIPHIAIQSGREFRRIATPCVGPPETRQTRSRVMGTCSAPWRGAREVFGTWSGAVFVHEVLYSQKAQKWCYGSGPGDP